jgi:hypothetical protein
MTSTPETTFTEDAALDEDVFDTQPLPALAGWVSADSGPSGLDTDSSYVPALAPSAAPAFSPGGELWREDRVNPQPRGPGRSSVTG